MLDAALEYAARGWRVVPILEGQKRPAINQWTKKATTDSDFLQAWWRSHPTHGIGIATGSGSGFFVVDVDGPTGYETLARLEATHGELPHTYMVNTGSGGRHYYFQCPRFEVRNDASKRLGPGLDIRGDGGQVVAPPTIHPCGQPYVHTQGDDPVPAPDWLLQLLQPAPTITPDVRPEHPDLDRRTDLKPGDRFNTETSWPQLLTADGWTHHHTDPTGEEHWTRPGKDRREGTSATVGYQGLDILHVFTTSVTGLDPEGTYNRFSYLTHTRYAGDYTAAARALHTLQDTQALTQWLHHTQTNQPLADMPTSDAETIASRFLVGDQIEELPPVEWLIDGIIERHAVGATYGPSGHYKSFIMLDMAAHIAAGRPWHGRDVHQGPVIYVAAEGVHGQGPRRRSWMTHYGIDQLDQLIWYPEAINLTIAHEILDFIEAARPYGPVLTIFDTLARCTVGAEENSAKDMGIMVAACDMVSRRIGGSVNLIHHAGKDTGRGLRGNTAILGAMNTVLAVERNSEGVGVKVEKQKNAEDGLVLQFQMHGVGDSVVPIEVNRTANQLPNNLVIILQLLEAVNMGEGVTWGQLLRPSGLSERTVSRTLMAVINRGYGQSNGQGKNKTYTLTEAGKTALMWGFDDSNGQ